LGAPIFYGEGRSVRGLYTAAMLTVIVVLAAYLIGSVSFASVVSRVFGLPDPRTYGSGNPGATNVARTGNKLAAALTLLGDALKGVLAVAAAQQLAARFALSEWTVPLALLAVFLGHVFPVFFGFRGGKGVATALGVLLPLDWRVALIAAAVWVAVFLVSRISSLSALVAIVVTTFASIYFFGPSATLWALLVMLALLIWRHTDNIKKLFKGSESGFRA
jgi:glycerol-3-phosphate acyltransferase PlsY